MIRTLSGLDLDDPAAVASAGRADVCVRRADTEAAPAGDGDGPLTWLIITPAETGWPADGALCRMLGDGVIGLALELPPLGALSDRETAELIAFLVRATSHGMPVKWHGEDLRAPADQLVHLTPPLGDRRWQAAHRPCMFCWRQGAGFIAVHDVRGDPGARYVIDEEDLLALFGRLAEPIDTRLLSAEDLDLLDQLLDSELALEIGDYAVGLAYRLRTWPTPVLHV